MPRLTARSQITSRRQKQTLLDHRDLVLGGSTLVDSSCSLCCAVLLRTLLAGLGRKSWKGLATTPFHLGAKADGINPSHRSHVNGGRWPLPCPSLQASLQSPNMVHSGARCLPSVTCRAVTLSWRPSAPTQNAPVHCRSCSFGSLSSSSIRTTAPADNAILCLRHIGIST